MTWALAEAEAAAAAGDAERAAALAEAALAGRAADAALRIAAAMLQARLGRPAAALAAVAPLLPARAPELADRLGMLAEALARIGALTEAVAVLRGAWRASPRPVMLRSLLANGLPAYRRSLNDGADGALLEEMAEAAIRDIAAIPAELLAELVRLAEDAGRDDLLRRLGQAGDGARARLVAGIGPEEAPNTAGLALLAAGRAGRAAVAFALAHRLAPEDVAARWNAGHAALAAGEAAAAEELLGGLPPAEEAELAGAAWPHFGELPWPFGAPPGAPAARLPPGAEWPRIRLVTPCRNPGPWLEETILSVAAQNYPAVEHVIVDAGSTDGTAELLARYRHRLHAVIIEPDRGPAEAIAKGFAGSTADLFGWINADDMLAPGALHHLAAAYVANPAADIVHGTTIAHRARRIIRHQVPLANGAEGFTVAALADVFGRWAEGAFFLQPETLITRRLWERLGGRLDTSLSAVFDYELWLRAAAAGARIASVRWPAAFYRIHPGQLTAARAPLAREQVAVRGRFLRPSPPPAALAALAARLRAALAPVDRPPRVLLLDQWAAETIPGPEREAATAALARQGLGLEIRAQPPEERIAASLIIRIQRAHDGAEWVAALRARGFAGPVIAWMVEDGRDPYAQASAAASFDVVVPATAAGREMLLQEAAPVLDPVAPTQGLAAALDAILAGLRALAA